MFSRSLLVALGLGLISSAGPAFAAAQQTWDACQSKDPPRAIPACSSIIPDAAETAQSRSDAYSFRAQAYLAQGNTDGAIRDYSEAIKLTPRNAVAYMSRALVYFHKGDRDKAILDYAIANKLDGSAVSQAVAGSDDLKQLSSAAAASPPPASALAFVDQLPTQSAQITPATPGSKEAAPASNPPETPAANPPPPEATPAPVPSSGPELSERSSSTPNSGATPESSSPQTATPQTTSPQTTSPETSEHTPATSGTPTVRWNSVAASIWKVKGRVHVAIGYSGTRSNEQDARDSAVQACRDAGGQTCKATGAWNFGCVYITTGNAVNRAGWGSGDSVDQAMSKCRGQGLKCKAPIGGCVN